MKKYLFLWIVMAFSSFIALAQEPPLDDAKRLLESWLDAQKDYEKLPGIAVAVIKDQDLLWKEGFGFSDVASENKTQPNTIYSICSISKLFTSIAIMQLRDAGKLSLEDEVSDILPWFKIKQQFEDSGPITIRALLTHSAGLPRQSNFPYWTGPDFDFPTVDQIKAQIKEMETLYPASTYFQYSNFGMTILGAIVQELSGMSFENYVEKNILNVLQLKDTRPFMPKDLLKGQLATGYSALNREGDRQPLDPFFTDGVTAAAGFTSTVEDLAKFASWQFRLLENGGEEVLQSSTLKEMQRVHWMDPDWELAWGLGFLVRQQNGHTVVGHGGSCPGYRTQLLLNPKKKLAFVVMINAGSTNPWKYIEGMSEVLGKALETDVTEMPDGINLDDYSGTYNAQPWSSETVVLPWYGGLAVMDLPTNNPASFTLLEHVEGDTFRRKRDDGALGEKVVFERDQNGKVVKMWQHQNYSMKLN